MTAPVPSRPSEVKDWCISGGFHPSKTLGQNFLTDGNTVSAILDAAEIAAGSRILEVGPGLGALTRPMLERGARVTAVEKDSRLAALLAESCAEYGDAFELINEDMLDVPMAELFARGFDAMVSNLPYSVGTRILLDACRMRNAPPRMVVMVQREVAQRLAAAPGDPDRGQAGVWVQARWRARMLRTVPPACFWPRPEISSTVVRLDACDRLPPEHEEVFYKVVKESFTQRRKQLASILKNKGALLGMGADAADIFAEAGIDPRRRPETLSHEEWLGLAAAIDGHRQHNP